MESVSPCHVELVAMVLCLMVAHLQISLATPHETHHETLLEVAIEAYRRLFQFIPALDKVHRIAARACSAEEV
jgi:hypothetical protein